MAIFQRTFSEDDVGQERLVAAYDKLASVGSAIKRRGLRGVGQEAGEAGQAAVGAVGDAAQSVYYGTEGKEGPQTPLPPQPFYLPPESPLGNAATDSLGIAPVATPALSLPDPSGASPAALPPPQTVPESPRGVFLDGFDVTGSQIPQAVADVGADLGLERDVGPATGGAPFATNAEGQLIERTQDFRQRTAGEVDARRNLRNDFIQNSALYEMERDASGNSVPKVDPQTGQPVEKIPKTTAEWERQQRALGEFDNKSAAQINAMRKDFSADVKFDKAVESGNRKRIDLAFGEKASRTALRELGTTDSELGVLSRSTNPIEKRLYSEYKGRLAAMTKGYKERDLASFQAEELSKFGEQAQKLNNQSLANEYKAKEIKLLEESAGFEIAAEAAKRGLTAKRLKEDGVTPARRAIVTKLKRTFSKDPSQFARLAPVIRWFDSELENNDYQKGFYSSLPANPSEEDVKERIFTDFAVAYNANPKAFGFAIDPKTQLGQIILSQSKDLPLI